MVLETSRHGGSLFHPKSHSIQCNAESTNLLFTMPDMVLDSITVYGAISPGNIDQIGFIGRFELYRRAHFISGDDTGQYSFKLR